MKKRERILILMEILSILRGGPKGPTRLAQSVGLSFDAFMEYAKDIESRRFVTKSADIEGHGVYTISAVFPYAGLEKTLGSSTVKISVTP